MTLTLADSGKSGNAVFELKRRVVVAGFSEKHVSSLLDDYARSMVVFVIGFRLELLQISTLGSYNLNRKSIPVNLNEQNGQRYLLCFQSFKLIVQLIYSFYLKNNL